MHRLLFLLQHAAIEIPKEWQVCMDLCFFPQQLREKQQCFYQINLVMLSQLFHFLFTALFLCSSTAAQFCTLYSN